MEAALPDLTRFVGKAATATGVAGGWLDGHHPPRGDEH
jgi:hypothetical protein